MQWNQYLRQELFLHGNLIHQSTKIYSINQRQNTVKCQDRVTCLPGNQPPEKEQLTLIPIMNTRSNLK